MSSLSTGAAGDTSRRPAQRPTTGGGTFASSHVKMGRTGLRPRPPTAGRPRRPPGRSSLTGARARCATRRSGSCASRGATGRHRPQPGPCPAPSSSPSPYPDPSPQPDPIPNLKPNPKPNAGSTRVACCCTATPRWRLRSGSCLGSGRRGSWRCARAARAAASCSRSGVTATSASTRPETTSPRPSASGPPGPSASPRCAGSTWATFDAHPEPFIHARPNPDPEPDRCAGSRGTATRRCWPRPPPRGASWCSMSRRGYSTPFSH